MENATQTTRTDGTGERKKRVRAQPLTGGKVVMVAASLAGGLVLAGGLALSFGSEPISPSVILQVLKAKLLGRELALLSTQQTILLVVRLPRILLGAVTGAALSVAGAMLQALLRNPLAEPYVLGISSGAAVGALVAMIVLPTVFAAQPLAAFAGALLTMGVIYAMSRTKFGVSTERLVLAGIIMASFLWSAIASLLAIVHNSTLKGITFWLMGDLSGGGHGFLALISVFVAAGIIVAVCQARSLNLLMVGEEDAFLLGVHVERVKSVAYIVASLLTGLVVAVSGSVGYVGLIIPHIVRLGWGTDNRLVIPASAFLGAIFVVLADTLGRTVIAPRELPVGAVTALVGAPVFVYLLRKR